MKKIIRLTESDLSKIVKKVLFEQGIEGITQVIPDEIKNKQKELSDKAKDIIREHMEYCELNKDKFSAEDSYSMDCEYMTKKFMNQPLSNIAGITDLKQL
jgi:hypothetical protein